MVRRDNWIFLLTHVFCEYLAILLTLFVVTRLYDKLFTENVRKFGSITISSSSDLLLVIVVVVVGGGQELSENEMSSGT